MDYLIASIKFFLVDSFWLKKITMDPHILAHILVYREYADDRYPKLKIYISEMIADSYQYIPAANLETNCMI
jgi:hypothetical protein